MNATRFSGPLATDLADFAATLEASATANKAMLSQLRALDRSAKEHALPSGTLDEAFARAWLAPCASRGPNARLARYHLADRGQKETQLERPRFPTGRCWISDWIAAWYPIWIVWIRGEGANRSVWFQIWIPVDGVIRGDGQRSGALPVLCLPAAARRRRRYGGSVRRRAVGADETQRCPEVRCWGRRQRIERFRSSCSTGPDARG